MSDGATPGVGPRGPEERWVQQLVPDGFEWEELVRRHPFVSLGVAAAGGFWIGRIHGQTLLRTFSDAVAQRLGSSLDAYARYAERR